MGVSLGCGKIRRGKDRWKALIGRALGLRGENFDVGKKRDGRGRSVVCSMERKGNTGEVSKKRKGEGRKRKVAEGNSKGKKGKPNL